MKKVIAIFLSILFGTIAFSQDYSEYIEQAKEYYNTGQYAEAIKVYDTLILFLRENFDTNDTLHSEVLSLAGMTWKAYGNYERADSLMRQSIEIDKAQIGENNMQYASHINRLGELCQEMGKVDEAEILMKQSIDICKQLLGEDNITYAEYINSLAELYRDIGLYDEAVQLVIKDMEIVKNHLGENHVNYANGQTLLADLYREKGNYSNAEKLYKQALQTYRLSIGENHPHYAIVLVSLGETYKQMGLYYKAEPLIKKAMLIDKELLGVNHTDYAVDLGNLAGTYRRMGRFHEAEEYYKESLKIQKEQLGVNHFEYGVALNNIALLYKDMGNYDLAEMYMKESLEIAKNIFGTEHIRYAIPLNNLAQIYLKMGLYEQSKPLLIDAFHIIETILGDKHPYYVSLLSSIANVQYFLGDYKEALEINKNALEICKEQQGEHNYNYLLLINNKARIYQGLGLYQESEMYYKQAIEIIKIIFGDTNHLAGRTWNSLGNLYNKIKLYSEAEFAYKKAIEIDKIQLDEKHPDYAIDLYTLGILYYDLGKLEKAAPLLNAANSNFLEQIEVNSGFLSEYEMNKFLSRKTHYFETYNSFIVDYCDIEPNIGSNAYNNELTLKGALLQSIILLRRTILDSNDTELIRMFKNWIAKKEQINFLVNQPIEKRYINVDSVINSAYILEKHLTRKHQYFNDLNNYFKIKWLDILPKLNENEVAIEFSSFNYFKHNEFTDSILYCASILRNYDTIPQFIHLCSESELMEVIPSPGASNRNINYSYREPELYELIWQPIDSLLNGIKTMYFAPSGLLNSVSMAAIPCPEEKMLMDKYNLVQLSSTRTLALPADTVVINDAVVYGGINYDTDSLTLSNTAEKYQEDENDLLAYNRSYTGDFRGGFGYLPGSEEELESITTKFNKKNIPVTGYSGTEAIEESFLALSGKNAPSVIHLSTHGFYFPDTVSDENRKNIMYSSTGEVRFRYNDDPLLRSGLLMAGSNLAWKGESIPDNVEDGILTAKEVSNMNLMNTQLVVLSACQSGLGDVKGSEGVEGLQRGFKMAGVRYIIMSLWQVPDKETTEFMETFYDNWLEGNEIHDAFRTTQITMKDKYKDNPFKWAGFVLME